MLPRNLQELQEKIGYQFHNEELLRLSLTHSSFANEHFGGDRIACNERLEFLGDSVLSLIVCKHLYNMYPSLPEGRLTLLRKNLVCQHALAGYAAQIELGDFLLLGKGEAKDGRQKPKLLEDAFEALLGALYLDSGELSKRVNEILKTTTAPQAEQKGDRVDYTVPLVVTALIIMASAAAVTPLALKRRTARTPKQQ